MNDDLISRQAVLNILEREGHKWGNDYRDWVDAVNEVEILPTVNPQEPKTIQEKQAESEKYEKAYDDGYKNGYAQARFDYEQEPKTGHWVGIDEEPHEDYECDKCGYTISTYTANIEPHTEYKYCPNCGAKMESEG